jgi:hypothetical protein
MRERRPLVPSRIPIVLAVGIGIVAIIAVVLSLFESG